MRYGGLLRRIDFKDLSGDKVYDFLKDHVGEDCQLIGGIIQERKQVGPLDARKTITLLIKSQIGEKLVTYNYNRVVKMI